MNRKSKFEKNKTYNLQTDNFFDSKNLIIKLLLFECYMSVQKDIQRTFIYIWFHEDPALRIC
jgi:hypothetical protein